MDVSLTTEVMAIFVILAYFAKKLVAMATSLRPLQPEMSCLHWLTPRVTVYTRTKKFVNSFYTSEQFTQCCICCIIGQKTLK